MKYNLIEKQLSPYAVTTGTVAPSEWIDVTGCDSICVVMTASDASTPGTANITLQGSLDKTNLITVGSPVSVAANGSYELSADRPKFKYYRVIYAIASGSYTSTIRVLCKGDKAG